MTTVYQQMRDLLAQEEREAQLEVEHELMASQNKLGNLTNRLSVNITALQRAKEDINNQLSQSQSMSFLQVGATFKAENFLLEQNVLKIKCLFVLSDFV